MLLLSGHLPTVAVLPRALTPVLYLLSQTAAICCLSARGRALPFRGPLPKSTVRGEGQNQPVDLHQPCVCVCVWPVFSLPVCVFTVSLWMVPRRGHSDAGGSRFLCRRTRLLLTAELLCEMLSWKKKGARERREKHSSRNVAEGQAGKTAPEMVCVEQLCYQPGSR